VIAQMHRVLEITKADPFFSLYKAYLSETDESKASVLGAKLDRIMPVRTPTAEEVIEKMRIPYPFLTEGKH
jgi:hypothetical protein